MSQTAIYTLEEISPSDYDIQLGDTGQVSEMTVPPDFGNVNFRVIDKMRLNMGETEFSIFFEKDPQSSADSTETLKLNHFYVCSNGDKKNVDKNMNMQCRQTTDMLVFSKEDMYWSVTKRNGSVCRFDRCRHTYKFYPETDGGTETQEETKLTYKGNYNLFKSYASDASYMYTVMLIKALDEKATCIAFKSSEMISSSGPKLFKDEYDSRLYRKLHDRLGQ